MGRSPYLHIVDDPVWSGASADDVIAALAGDEELSVVSSPTTSPCATVARDSDDRLYAPPGQDGHD